jgi:hypothetical protein
MVALGTMEELRETMRASAYTNQNATRNGSAGSEHAPEQRSLEDIFLELTGDVEELDLSQYLG